MALFYHFPLCPQSRFIRLVMSELAMEAEMMSENIHDRRRGFLEINPAATLPVLVEQDGPAICGAGVIAEYLDETRGLVLGERRLLPENPAARAEVRRLLDWFNLKCQEEVSGLLLHEKVYKRLLPVNQGGGAPDPGILRVARSNIRYHLKYIGYLAARRNWLAGEQLSYADLAAAAHLSTADYLGDVPWDEDETAKTWYARIKSRPSFRILLNERMRGLPPGAHYADLDF